MVNITSKDNVINVVGEVDIVTAKDFEDAIMNLVEQDCPLIILDLTGMDFIDSTGIGVLMNIKKNVLKDGQDIILYQPKRSIQKIFKLTGVEQVFTKK